MTVPIEYIEAMMAAGCSVEQLVAVLRADHELRERRRRERAERRSASQASQASRGDAVTVGNVTEVTPVTLRRSDSAGAIRTRRWRERQQMQAIARFAGAAAADAASRVTSVTEFGDVTAVTVAPGRTPLKGVQPMAAPRHRSGWAGRASERAGPEQSGQKRPRRRADRAQRELALLRKVEGGADTLVKATDPLFEVLGAMRGKAYPVSDRENGWWFPAGLVAEARERLAASSQATGPPRAAEGG